MKKKTLARMLATDTNVSTGEAADRLDQVFYEIAKKLRRGEAARLPGLGCLEPAANAAIVKRRPRGRKAPPSEA